MTPVYRRECPQQNTLSLERVDPTHRPEARAQAGTARLTTGAKAPTLAAGFFCQTIKERPNVSNLGGY